jgi:hypothetical protein
MSLSSLLGPSHIAEKLGSKMYLGITFVGHLSLSGLKRKEMLGQRSLGKAAPVYVDAMMPASPHWRNILKCCWPGQIVMVRTWLQ